MLAFTDEERERIKQAVQEAENSDDCPICDVLRDGERVGQVL